MRKRAVCISLVFLLLLAGCSYIPFDYIDLNITPSPSLSPSPIILPSPAPRAITFGIAFSPVEVFQPLTDTLRYNNQAARLCYEGLFELNEQFIPQPLLCTEMQTDDNIHFTFTLREDVLFHDGNTLTAADVVYSVNLARTPGGPYSGRLSCVADVSAQDGGTVLLTMDKPVWNAAALFDFPIVRQSSAAAAPGTGPYRAVISGEENYLLAAASWWQGKTLPVERINLVSAAEADTLVYSFQYGYISVLPIDTDDTLSPGIHAGYEKVTVPSGLMQYIGINTARAPLDQPELRRALALALDRRDITAAVYGDSAEAAVLPVPPSSPLYLRQNAIAYRFDPGEASRLIAGLGYTSTDIDGVLERRVGKTVEKLSLDMIVDSANASRVSMAERCAAAFRAAGFSVNVRALSRTAFDKALQNSDYDLYYAEARPVQSFDPGAFLDGTFAAGAASDALLDAVSAMHATDPYTPEGEAALAAVWDGFYEEIPILTVCFRKILLISQRGLLSGQTPTFSNAFYHWADWLIRWE